MNRMRSKQAALLITASVLIGNCSRTPRQAAAVSRIVSLAPSITETLFALGLGGKVVGVTSYCHFPPEADSIEEIGGYIDANLERIVTLDPDLVVLQREHEKQRSFLDRYGIRSLTVNYSTTADICSSFASIGRECGAVRAADSLICRFDSLLWRGPPAADSPRVLLCVGRDSPGGGAVGSVFAAGAGSYYNDLILAAGGVNAYAGTVPDYPRLSSEGLITLAPDIVIDIASAMGEYSCSTLVADWKTVAMVPAVQRGRVHCLSADYATIPGPRTLLLLEDLKKIIRGERP
jgi:iron complex transport system substrate-binding protein